MGLSRYHHWLLGVSSKIMVGILLYLPFHTFISTWVGAMVGETLMWKSAKDVVIFAVLMAVSVGLMLEHRLSKEIKKPLHVLIVSYAGVTVLSAILTWQGAQTAAGLLMNLRYVAAVSVMMVVVRAWSFSHRQVVQLLAWAGVVLGWLGVIQVLLPAEFLTLFGYGPGGVAPYVTVDQNSAWLRAFATLSGPNDYGAYLIMCLIAGWVLRRWWMMVPIGLGLFLSYSRSAWIGAVVALVVFGLMRYGRQARRRIMMAGGLLVLLAGMVVVMATQVPAVRLAVFHSSPGDSSLIEGSTMAHLIETTNGLWRVMTQPLGCGVGCAGPASQYGDDAKVSENYYIQIAEEVGVLGLGLWLAIFVLAMRGLWQQRRDELAQVLFASGCGLAVIGLFLHVWADDPLSITWWALAGLVIGKVVSRDNSRGSQAASSRAL